MTKSEIKVLVVDDELLARKRIRSLLSEHADIKIVGECVNGREAINAMHNLAPDLVFLDIQMPEINGLQVIGSLDDEKRPLFVFVTAYSLQMETAKAARPVVSGLPIPAPDSRIFMRRIIVLK